MPAPARVTDHLAVVHGHIHVGVLHDGAKAMLFDCGDGGAVEAARRLGVETIDAVAFTHHHRDQACGAHALADGGAGIGVPAAERHLFDDVASFWSDPKRRGHLYDLRPHPLTLAEPVSVNATYDGGGGCGQGARRDQRWGVGRLGTTDRQSRGHRRPP